MDMVMALKRTHYWTKRRIQHQYVERAAL